MNTVLFADEIPKFDITIKYLTGAWAYCIKYTDNTFEIEMNNSFPTKELFANVLGHEMVHIYQMTNGDSGNHNSLFYSFRDAFSENGYQLKRVYNE